MIPRLVVWTTKRFRWILIGAAIRAISRRAADRQVRSAAEEFESKLHPTVARAIKAVPGDLSRTTGSAIVAQRYARRAVGASGRVVGVTATGVKGASRAAGRVRSAKNRVGETTRGHVGRGRRAWSDVGDEVVAETELARRQLVARSLRESGDTTSSDEALLDLRPDSQADEVQMSIDELVDTIPDAVPPGRNRRRPEAPKLVDRVRRGYRRPTKPWD